MADTPKTPTQQAMDRLAWEAQYLRDVLHLAGPSGVCQISTASLRATYEGLTAALDLIRQQQPAATPTPQPAAGGAPAAPVAGGG